MKHIFKIGIVSAVALVAAAGIARAAEVTDEDRRAVNEAIASHDPGKIKAMCELLDARKQSADTGQKIEWEKLKKKLKCPPPGGGGGGGIPGGTAGGTVPGNTGNQPPTPPKPPKKRVVEPPENRPVQPGGGGSTSSGTQVPAPPVLPNVIVPPYFCSEAAKRDTMDELFREANAVREYMDQLWVLLGASNKTLRDNLVAGDPALIAAYKDALHEHQTIDELYEKARKTRIKNCTLEEHSMAPGGYRQPVPSYAKSFVALDGGIALNHYKFEDDFNSRHTAAVVGLRAGADWNIGGGWTVGPMGGIYAPFGSADKLGLETGINWFGTAEVKAATPIASDIRVWGSGGFAFGQIENRTATFNQSVVAPGWTGAVGINYEFRPTWNVGLTYRYLQLGPKFVEGLGTGVKADSSQLFISFQKNFPP